MQSVHVETVLLHVIVLQNDATGKYAAKLLFHQSLCCTSDSLVNSVNSQHHGDYTAAQPLLRRQLSTMTTQLLIVTVTSR